MLRRLSIFFLFLLITNNTFADTRQDIDTKREGVSYQDKRALELSRDFIKADSNYYVGWLYAASARFYSAQDKFGYTLASKLYEKAITKFEKDYSRQLRVNTTDLMAYIDAYPRQIDYTFMANQLFTCYMSTEQLDKAYSVCKGVMKYRMINYFYIDPYNSLAWIVHRSRTSTSKEFKFLKDNVIDNERLALKLCDSASRLVTKNYAANAMLFGDAATSDRYNYSNFYKAMIYTYLCIPDSAELFYSKLKNTPHFSHNNYAYLKLVLGDFGAAESEFLIEKERDNPSEKRTKEFTYMLSIFNIYKGVPQLDVDSLPNYIQNRGEIPGFGWDNLALARSCYYAGNHNKSMEYLEKAATFQELHLNTSWSPEQYNYSISLLKYLNSERDVQLAKFNNKGWWYNIPTLMQLPKLYFNKMTNSHKLTSDFALNKERELAFYQLFNSECLITFDEIWKTIEGYNTDFFIKKYEDYTKLENRKGVRRYYYYFLAKLHYKKKDYDKATDYVKLALADGEANFEKERLLEARLLELKALIFEKQGNDKESEFLRNSLYETYPSLLLFSDLEKPFKVSLTSKSATLDSVVSEFKSTGIRLIEDNNHQVICPVIELSLEETNKGKLIKYSVRSSGIKVTEGNFMVKENAGILLAYRVFNINVDEVDTYGNNNIWLIISIGLVIALLWYVYSIKKRRSML